jgi:serine/threonine-protein kinase
MSRCTTCQASLTPQDRWCPSCGAAIDATPDPTADATQVYQPAQRRGNGGVAATRAAFAAGTLLAGRYRIVGQLGKGGMGTVYRAEDLKLGADVALKFLAEALVAGERGVALLLNEVKLARQITHPNVCRVHDIGEIDGNPFISMEYVDGEDLSSLLRRIGHLPREKALQIARQLAAGLYAAHEQGVLHRDLKPANVMLDGAGNVRITDFGIAGELHQLGEKDSSTGTPAYMAPELFTGTVPSQRSDVFSLGLVLYELYTGRSLFQASTMTELLRQHRQPVRPPSELVPGLDPEVEGVILRCLQRDPSRRPASAFEVLAELPGGNALAELAATGRTPSPDQVVVCGGSGALCRSSALVLVALILLGLGAVFALEKRVKLVSRAPLPESAEVLAHEASRYARSLGFAPGDSRDFGFDLNVDYLIALRRDPDPARWTHVHAARPPAIDFWYRESPLPLVAEHLSGKVTWGDPPLIQPGMLAMRLAPEGALRELQVVPRALAGAPLAGAAPDPAPLFAAARLDAERFVRAEPERIPPAYADTRMAWRGPGGADAGPVRVEAAFLAGQPVAFSVAEERWAQALRYKPERARSRGSALADGIKLLLLVAAVALAWSAFRGQRSDFRGAFRFALTIFFLVVAVTVLTAKHTSDPASEGQLVLRGMARGLLVAVQYWIFYIALEPQIRHMWPETIISWSRLLQGRIRDPLVGSNVLLGIAVGIFATVCVFLVSLSDTWSGMPEGVPFTIRDRAMEALVGAAPGIGACLEIGVYFTGFCMSFVMALVVLRMLLRSRWLAAIVWTAVQTVLWRQAVVDPSPWSWLLFGALAAACTLVMIRVGFLAVLIGAITFGILGAFPLQTDPSSWLIRPTLLALAVIGAGLAFGLVVTLRARPGTVPAT